MNLNGFVDKIKNTLLIVEKWITIIILKGKEKKHKLRAPRHERAFTVPSQYYMGRIIALHPILTVTHNS